MSWQMGDEWGTLFRRAWEPGAVEQTGSQARTRHETAESILAEEISVWVW